MSPGPQPTADADFWVERGTRYLDTSHRAMDIPRSTLDPAVTCQLYEEFSTEWLAENPTFPHSQGRDEQEEFYKRVDEACASLDTIQQDDWRGMVRICCMAQAGIQAIIRGGFQFPEESPFRVAVWKRIASDTKVLTGKRIQAGLQAAGQKFDTSVTAMSTPEVFGLRIDETVTFFHPETDEDTEITILGFGVSKGKGRWFTVAYAGDPDVEVELSEEAMEEILMARIDAEISRVCFELHRLVLTQNH